MWQKWNQYLTKLAFHLVCWNTCTWSLRLPETVSLGKPGHMERSCVHTLVSSPSHHAFPVGIPDIVGHRHAISFLSLLCSFQIPNPPNLWEMKIRLPQATKSWANLLHSKVTGTIFYDSKRLCIDQHYSTQWQWRIIICICSTHWIVSSTKPLIHLRMLAPNIVPGI